MSYHITEEISSFWNSLALPVILGITTCFLIVYLIDKSNRDKIIKWLVEDYKGKYVLENGIYIPYDLSKRAKARRKICKIFNASGFQFLLIVFIGLVIMFGLYRIVVMVFQPQLTYNGNILFSSGVDNYILAVLWSQSSNTESLYGILNYVRENADVNNDLLILYGVEAYIRFYIIICILVLFLTTKEKTVHEKKEIRWKAVKMIFLLFILLIGIYALQIRNDNKIMERQCQLAYYELDKNMLVPEYAEVEIYIEKIEKIKEESDTSNFPGTYSLRIIRDCQSVVRKVKDFLYALER